MAKAFRANEERIAEPDPEYIQSSISEGTRRSILSSSPVACGEALARQLKSCRLAINAFH